MTISDRDAAEAFLDARIGRGVKPGLDRMRGLLDYLADPHHAYPVIHVAGTNGKTTVCRLVTDLLGAHGLVVGTFVSPHLHRVEERFSIAGRPVDAARFATAVDEIAWMVEEYERRHEDGPTYFELTTALAFSLFAAEAVDVAVVEVGLGGRLDATNVVEAAVAVVTGIGLDHEAELGETKSRIAREKVAILDEGGRLVTGPVPAEAEGPITARVAETGARWYRFGGEFRVVEARRAVGGWSADVSGIHGDYEDLYLPLHGRHQVDNLATAVATTEAFLGRALDVDAVRAAAGAATAPGRLEVVARTPLVVVDGAHNPQGMAGLARTLDEEFPDLRRVLVVGVRGGRDLDRLLAPLRGLVHAAVATTPADPAGRDPEEVAAAARRVLEVPTTTTSTVAEAVARALDEAEADGAVIVAGSLYVAGEARAALGRTEIRPSPVHARIEPPDELPEGE